MKNKLLLSSFTLPFLLAFMGMFTPLKSPSMFMLSILSLLFLIFSYRIFKNIFTESKVASVITGTSLAFMCLELALCVGNASIKNEFLFATITIQAIIFLYSVYKESFSTSYRLMLFFSMQLTFAFYIHFMDYGIL